MVIGFGEDKGTGDIPEKINPMIEGLTTGHSAYDGIFILRNPENCNLIDFSLKDIPIYMERKLRINYEVCMDFLGRPKKSSIQEIEEASSNKIKDLDVTSFILDPSNLNTHILRLKDETRKKFGCMWRF